MEELELGELSFNFTAILNTHPQEHGLASYIRHFFERQEVVTPRRSVTDLEESISELDFSQYLDTVEDELRTIRRRTTRRPQLLESVVDEEVECFGRVPYVYYQKDFCLDFGCYGEARRMQEQQQQLNDYLDLVELNLFRQVTHRFNDFFKILKNLEFLDRAVLENIQRLKQMRERVNGLREGYYRTASALQRKVYLQQNKEKLMKHFIIIRSLRKLPPTINSVLESSLPYECVSLLASGKQKYKLVAGLECLKNVGKTLENGDNIVKHSLYKQFSDKIFLYLTAPITPPFGKRLAEVPQLGAVLSNISQNGSSVSESMIGDEGYYYLGPAKGEHQLTITNTEEEISRIIVESYLIVDYGSNSQLRTKLLEFIKIVSKTFQDELRTLLSKVIKQQRDNLQSSIIGELTAEHEASDETSDTLEDLCEEISLPYYGKLLLTFHEMFRSSIMRLLGCTYSLILGLKKLKNLQPEKARALIEEFLSIVVAICKFVCDRAVTFLALKHLTHDTSIVDFSHYLCQLVYWQHVSQGICSLEMFQPTDDPVFGDKLIEYRVKLQSTFETVKNTKRQLQQVYVNNLHRNVITNELKGSLEDDTWAAMEELPSSYRTMFSFILNGEEAPQQKIVRKFDDVNSSLMNSFFAETPMGALVDDIVDKRLNRKPERTQFKLLKSVAIVGRRQFKMTVALMLFVEILQEYLRMQKIYPETHDMMMEKISELVRAYSLQSYQLIVAAGALKFEKIKTKNITARQLCLSWNCLQFILALLDTFSHPEMKKAVDALNQHCDEIVKRLSSIITLKVDNEVASLCQLNLRSQVSGQTQQTSNIIANYKQMLEILLEYMQQQTVRQIMLPAINIIVKKYITHLEENGIRGREEALFFISEMKVLEVGFEKELTLIREMFVKSEE